MSKNIIPIRTLYKSLHFNDFSESLIPLSFFLNIIVRCMQTFMIINQIIIADKINTLGYDFHM